MGGWNRIRRVAAAVVWWSNLKLVVAAVQKLHSADKNLQNEAFQELMELTREPVHWTYEIWDDIVRTLTDSDNRRRAIAAQVWENLAKSDPENRMTAAFPQLLHGTRDERFVTARHCMESFWKVAIVSAAHREMVAAGLALRFAECAAGKNTTLIRCDITVVFRQIFYHTQDESIRTLSQQLIATEPDEKYRKKYAGVWRKK